MAEKRIISGLDIGTTKICAIIGEYDPTENVYKILGLGKAPSNGLRRGVVVDIGKTTNSIIEAVKIAQMQADTPINGVTIGIAGDHIRSFNSTSTIVISHKGGNKIQDSEIDQSDVKRALDSVKSVNVGVDREIMHIIQQKYQIDNQMEITNPIGLSGSKLTINALIITAAINNVKDLVRSVQSTGLNVHGVVLEPLSSAESVLTEDQKELGVALIDIGGGTTDVTVFQKGYVKHAGVVGYGGSIITNDVASIIHTSFMEAERIKTNYAYASTAILNENNKVDISVKTLNGQDEIQLDSYQLSLYVEARMEEILLLVKEQIEKFIDIKKLSGGIIFTGGGSLLRGLNDTTKKIFGVASQIGYPTRLPGLEKVNLSPEYSTAIGLLHWSKLNDNKQNIMSVDSDAKIWHKIKDFLSTIIKEYF
ncbi:MAG: cell division protein FtsA [Candidatus Marinimicrobia bacterium]|nr:cell division protein FtsA [Candidatus Neomarinimicrobiota bacterium]